MLGCSYDRLLGEAVFEIVPALKPFERLGASWSLRPRGNWIGICNLELGQGEPAKQQTSTETPNGWGDLSYSHVRCVENCSCQSDAVGSLYGCVKGKGNGFAAAFTESPPGKTASDLVECPEGVARFIAALAELCCLVTPEPLDFSSEMLSGSDRPPLKIYRFQDFRSFEDLGNG